MSGETFNDAFMLEIFRSEVEAHVESLTSGLLALERDPDDTSHIDEMMRGAHSIKGAARIVGIDPAVRIAHVMEDGFIAAQHGKLTIRPEHVDTLLRGVDMLNRIANGSKDPSVDWSQFESEAAPLVEQITAVLTGSPTPVASPKTAVLPAPHPVTSPSTPTPPSDVTITLPAFFDATAAEVARKEFVTGLDSQARVIRINLSQTLDLDATGLALLAAIPRQIATGQTRLVLQGMNDSLHLVLTATGVKQQYTAEGH